VGDAVVHALHTAVVMKAIAALAGLLLSSCIPLDEEAVMQPPDAPSEPSPPDDETPEAAAQRVLEEFSDCMTFADFESANMTTWAAVPTATNQQCASCHNNGGESFIATADPEDMFVTLQKSTYMLLRFVTPDLSNGVARARMIVNRPLFESVGLGSAPYADHPGFEPDLNAGMTALEIFHALTMERLATECATPTPP
jgi:hypothetical protein